jgi:hypothetical protein
VKRAIESDSPSALRRAFRRFKSRPSLYLELQILALDYAKVEKDKDWVYDIVDAINFADVGRINSVTE